MKSDQIITIGRQFGSGGRYIGRKVADRLGIAFYDKELLAEAAKESGISEQLFENVDEQAVNSILYSLALGAYASANKLTPLSDISMNDRLFQLQAGIIRRIAQEHPAVIVGRCADYILRDHPHCLNVFIHAPIEARVKRAVQYYGLDPATAKDSILKMDKKRVNYYNYYSSKKWGLANGYHLSLDSDAVGIDGAVQLICDFLELEEDENKNR